MKTSRLHSERLEDRLAPANLTLTNLQLVDAYNVPQANPVFGQRMYLRASWSSNGMTGTEACPIRITANGIPLDTGTISFPAGGSSGTQLLDGWYAGTSMLAVSAAIDPDAAVIETDETDNAFNLNVTPIAPIDLPAKFVQPMGRTANVDWTIGNYADVDPRPGFANSKDKFGGPYQYDYHDAIDAGGFGNDLMDAGQPVFAAAAGTVTFYQDGKFDREMWNYTSDGNYLFIDHGNGWDTVYFHLAKDSLTVKSGDTVKAGQVIALMGASGYSGGGAHLHYTARYRGAAVEPLFSPGTYWQNPLPYSGDVAPFAWDAFVSNREPEYYDMHEKHARVSQVAATDSGNLYFTAATWNVKTPSHTTIMSWKWYRPNGTLWNEWPAEYSAAFDSRNDYWYWFQPVSAFADTPGTWQYAFHLDGVEVKRVPFTIAAAGEPSLRVKTINPIIGSTNQIVIDERTTPFELGSVAQGGTAPTWTFTLENQGSGALNLGGYSLPPGFSFVGTPPVSVAANSQADLVVQLDTAIVGAKFGRLRFTTNDPQVPEMNFNVAGTVTGTPVAGAPAIGLPDKALGYNFKSLPRVFAPTATVTDSDSANFGGGSLLVEIASGAATMDQLGVRDQGSGAGQIGQPGGSGAVTYSGTLIGNITGGLNTLTVSLNAAATLPAVQALVRNLTFANVGTTPTYQRRYLRVTLTDNAGKVSNLAIAHVTPSGVEKAPVIAALADASTAINVPFVRNGSFADSFGTSWTATVQYFDGTGTHPLTLNPDKTFTLTRTYPTPGNRTVLVTITSDAGGISTATMTVSVFTPPTVSGYTVNDGASQRSRLTKIVVNFGTPQNAANFQTANSVTLTRTAATSTGAVGTVVTTGGSGMVVTPTTGFVSSINLIFVNGVSAGTEHGSLADGRWRLAIPGLSYQSVLNDPALRRLFGDGNNDGTIDGNDLAAFGAAFGTSGFSPYDFNFDFTVDALDFGEFGNRFGLTI